MKNKLFYSSLVGLTLGTIGFSTLKFNTQQVLAKTRFAKVISYKKLSNSPYNVNGGYIYTNARLNKKSHDASHYLNKTFYALESAKVKKNNGKIAIYYYLKSSNGKIKGWIWSGNVSKKVIIPSAPEFPTSSQNSNNQNVDNYAQQKSDINNMLAIVRSMDSEDQDYVLSNFEGITPKNAYSDISDGISEMSNDITNYDTKNEVILDAQAIQKTYQLFNNRFDSTANNDLSALSSRLNDAFSENDTDSISSAASNLADELSTAVLNLG
ncbi:hypothetical protein FC51_GL001660 [Lentilactobacillus parabuchneri DSM 5707 = NBRC 107865]|jgi:hypothetical protein|uniref:D-alanyl-D-alanine carboxypeptidase n=2 Tax=Lentilactobacillus parabuchneri TaxID=152331 RepID=A0A0R1YNR0_9LACO|nr:hypothetical protein [Lentilactobacillus parabuchneri]KRM44206.1 hypothetical protein FC51_GL001660 [Lentilactobacillus parabuchneri DSM 5707 = NBRC 107865]MDG9738430.1 hypothetical protein [Lentilactobacillus parabuchneri]